MSIELITGYAGEPHISSADDGARNIGTFGAGKYVLDTGAQLACSVQSANAVTIGTGDVLFEGRHVRMAEATTVAIDNGAQGVSRNDIICIKYERNLSTTVEQCSFAVIKGTATSGTPTDPAIPSGSIAEGANEAYMPLWRIPISGITVGTPVKLYGDVLPDMHELATRVTPVDQVPNISAAKITSGTLAIARGGTGAATWSPNFVLAGPASGTASAAPTRRKLVAADLPDSITSSTSGNAATATKAAKLSTARSLYVNLGASYDSSNPVTFDGSANKALPVTGTLPVAKGGTNLTASPSMLTNLGSTSAANVLQASPRPGVTGTLPVGNGGTGRATLTSNAVLAGNGTSAVKQVATASGALYATSANGAPVFGKLPIAQGGTNATTAADARANLGITPANIGAMAKPAQIYHNTSGTKTVTSASIASYRFLRIFYTTNKAPTSTDLLQGSGSVVIDSNVTNKATIISGHISGVHAIQLRIAEAVVSDNSVELKRYIGSGASGTADGHCVFFNVHSASSAAVDTMELGANDEIWIYRVEGWN